MYMEKTLQRLSLGEHMLDWILGESEWHTIRFFSDRRWDPSGLPTFSTFVCPDAGTLPAHG